MYTSVRTTRVQEVFDIAIHLMDEQNETNGQTVTSDTNEYKVRTISILNAIIPSLYPYSDNYDTDVPGRPIVHPLLVDNYAQPDFTQLIPLDDTLSRGVLPYGLAAHLLAGENEELSAWMMQRFNMAFADLRNKIPGEWEPINLPYGTF